MRIGRAAALAVLGCTVGGTAGMALMVAQRASMPAMVTVTTINAAADPPPGRRRGLWSRAVRLPRALSRPATRWRGARRRRP
ncbi:MAG TPA: hypothetical protein VH912_24995 [Streptosporangiaceae bacterium]